MKYDLPNLAESISERLNTSTTNLISIEDIHVALSRINLSDFSSRLGHNEGKRLVVSKIFFRGVKKTNENGELYSEEFTYERRVKKGINMWIADNFRGKSTTFNIIRYALTGKNNYIKNKNWFEEIKVDFKIDSTDYTSSIDKSSKIPYQLLEVASGELLIEETSQTRFKEQLNSFFLENLGFMSLSNTTSKAQDFSIGETKISWSDCYGTIYLHTQSQEDEKGHSMGGRQNLVFRILLNLEAHKTVLSNMFKTEIKTLEQDIKIDKAKQKLKDSKKIDLETIRKQLSVIESKIAKKKNTKKFDTSVLKKLENERNSAYNKQKELYKIESEHQKRLNKQKKNKENTEKTISSNKHKVNDANRSLTQIKKDVRKYEEYIDAQRFFSNIEVSVCPHCDHKVAKEKILREKTDKVCGLCSHGLEEKEFNSAYYNGKITEMNANILAINQAIDRYEKDIDALERVLASQETEVQKAVLSNETTNQEKITISKDLEQLEIKYDTEFAKYESWVKENQDDNIFELHEEKGMITSILKQAEKYKYGTVEEWVIEHEQLIKIYTEATHILSEESYNNSAEAFGQLEQLILTNLHNFGLKNIDKVNIRESFLVEYKQNGEKLLFKNFSDGEKLRINLAKFLSIIELDINLQIGQHPRFIVLDSPANAESDDEQISALRTTFKHIENKFGDKLQIFVGTAERELKDSVDPDKLELVEKKKYLF